MEPLIDFRIDLYYQGILRGTLPFSKVTLGYERNNIKRCSIVMNGNDLDSGIAQYLIEFAYVKIYMKPALTALMTENNTTYKEIYAGEISIIHTTEDNRGEVIYDITVEHWQTVILQSRVLTFLYTDYEESAIASAMLFFMQNSGYLFPDLYDISKTIPFEALDWGIVPGFETIEDTGNIRTIEVNQQTPLSILQSLANLNDIAPNPQRMRGFWLTPTIMYNSELIFYYRANLGVTRLVNYTKTTIQKIERYMDNSQYANRVLETGQNKRFSYSSVFNSGELYNPNHTANHLREVYIDNSQINTDSYTPVYDEGGEVIAEIVSSGLLQDATDRELLTRINNIKVYKITLCDNDVFAGQYDIGDKITVNYQGSVIQVNQIFTVLAINYTFDNRGLLQSDITIADGQPSSIAITEMDKLIKNLVTTRQRLSTLERLK